MAYDANSFQLTKLLQDAWYKLGQLRRWKVTGGSQTTVINTSWAGVEEPVFEDDDPALIYGTVIVLKDTAGAAPEGEFGMITDYDSSSQTITMDSLTTGVAANDRVGIATPFFPLEDMIELATIALQRLGDLEIPDTSLLGVAGQTEYTLPAAVNRRPIQVNRQTVQASGNNQWTPVSGWDVIPPATIGGQWTLVLPANSIPASYTLQVIYSGVHPKLTAYDSPILETIHPELATAALVAEAYQWYNNQVGGSNEYYLQRENKAIQDLESALVRYPIQHIQQQVKGFPHWGKLGQYVPGTSDLRA